MTAPAFLDVLVQGFSRGAQRRRPVCRRAVNPWCLVVLSVCLGLAAVQAERPTAADEEDAVVMPDLMKRRTAEYDYDPPAAGSYRLPVLQPAVDGTVLNTDFKPVRLHELMQDRVVVLSVVAHGKLTGGAHGKLTTWRRGACLSREGAGRGPKKNPLPYLDSAGPFP
ncbi:MAG: hypothetical protein M5U12_29595 [Verrucomicrobia bacterium]|nr:hypothetical protein [Verrucomicrobiota bacterium]